MWTFIWCYLCSVSKLFADKPTLKVVMMHHFYSLLQCPGRLLASCHLSKSGWFYKRTTQLTNRRVKCVRGSPSESSRNGRMQPAPHFWYWNGPHLSDGALTLCVRKKEWGGGARLNFKSNHFWGIPVTFFFLYKTVQQFWMLHVVSIFFSHTWV